MKEKSLKLKFEKKYLQINLVVRFYSNAEILNTINKTGYVYSKMLPKRQQLVFQEF